MKNFLNGKIATVIILLATFVLAGVAIFTAIRLYQLRQTSVAPNVPSSQPKAAGNACSLSFTLTTTPTTPTVHVNCSGSGVITATVTWSEAGAGSSGYYVDVNDANAWTQGHWWHQKITSPATLTATIPTGFTGAIGGGDMPALVQNSTYYVRIAYLAVANKYSDTVSFSTSTCSSPTPIACNQGCGAVSGTPCQTGLTCYQPDQNVMGSNICRNPQCPLETTCTCPGSTPTPTPTGTPNSCNGTCGSNSNCNNDLVCSGGFCRNPNCTSSTNCVCSSTTPTPTPTGSSTPTPTPIAPALPQSGTDWPTTLGIGIGILAIIGSLILAL